MIFGSPALSFRVKPERVQTRVLQLETEADRLPSPTRQLSRLPTDRRAFIGPSRLGSGAYDLTQILPPSAPLVKDDELWFYYTGLKYRTSWTYVGKYPKGKEVFMPGKEKDAGAVCLAVLRRDGFISLDAGKESGSVVTKPLEPESSTLHVNVDATSGSLEVTAIDGNGKPIAISEPVTGDMPRAAIRWKSGKLSGRRGESISLRFKLQNASLYSFWFDAK